MADLYPDTPCDACQKSHALYLRHPPRHPAGGSYSYTCPETHRAVAFRPQVAPDLVILVPREAVPLTRGPD